MEQSCVYVEVDIREGGGKRAAEEQTSLEESCIVGSAKSGREERKC